MKKQIKKLLNDLRCFTLAVIAFYFHKKEYCICIHVLTYAESIKCPYKSTQERGLFSIEYHKQELWISILFINHDWYFGKKWDGYEPWRKRIKRK